MLRSRYRISLFSQWGRPLVSLNVNGLVLLAAPLLILGLTALNGWLVVFWQHWQDLKVYEARLDAERLSLSQRLLLQSAALNEMESRMRRIADFDAKLRIMLNMGAPGDGVATLLPAPRTGAGLTALPALRGRNHLRGMRQRLERLDGEIVTEEVRQQHIGHAIAAQLETLTTIPVILPTHGRFSSPFGWRNDPFTGGRRFHKGIDLTAPTGTPVRATANGVITHLDRSPSYGLVIVITHSAELATRYAHLSRAAVTEGQRVLRGQIIGFVGNTGRSKAPHLHYEVQQRGMPVNPRNYILQ